VIRPAAFEALVTLHGIGIDLCEVKRMERELAREEGGFRDAVFTVGEIAYCEAQAHPSSHFAARFAAKEAVFKALAGNGVTAPAWREIEIVSSRPGEPLVVLHGATGKQAAERGVASVLVSLSHAGELAVATAAAVGAPGEGREGRR
jgi:holo-[acyl-carrier protein] synthase